MSDAAYLPLRADANPPRGGPVHAQHFAGRGGPEIPAAEAPSLGTGDFTVATWLHVDADGGTVGDLVSRFDPATRRGFALSCVTNGGVTSTGQANLRGLQFGVDAGRLPDAADPEATSLVGAPSPWLDRGRPGNATKVAALHASCGDLFAGTFELDADGAGHLWRFAGGSTWHDLGAAPDGASMVDSIARYDGGLYATSSRYLPFGSALGPLRNPRPGGTVWRLDADGAWVDCGRPGGTDATPEQVEVAGYATGKADHASALTVFGGQLVCTSHHRRGAFFYEGGTSWRPIGPDARLISFVVFEGELLTLVNGGPVLRWDGGTGWEPWGHPDDSTQTYSAAVYGGRLYVGTWPEGTVHRRAADGTWQALNRPGFEREIMAMAVYNQKLFIGSLPMAHVWRLDPGPRGDEFTFVGNLDATPAAPLRRVWSMAVHDGRLFAGTLPAGRVWSLQAGTVATDDGPLAAGWHHVAGVRRGRRLELWLDGARVGGALQDADVDVDAQVPLRLGDGAHAALRGWLGDTQLAPRALEADEIAALARS